MKNILYLSVLSLLIFSCSSAKKFDYANAYHFSTYKSTNQQNIILNEPKPVLIASRTAVIGQVPNVPERLPLVTPQQGVQQLNKKEKRGILKEIKAIGKELRSLKKIDPIQAEIEAQKATKALTGKVYAGTVIGIAGLILLILDIASPLGVLAFVVGLGLIVWGLLERGSF